jgi:hypothetical protein
MDDFLSPALDALFEYFERTPPPVTSSDRLLDAERWAQAAEVGAARTRWLDEHHAERTFSCGVVRRETSTDVGAVIVEVFVTAVVTDTSVVFLVDRPDGNGGVPVEVGSSIGRPSRMWRCSISTVAPFRDPRRSRWIRSRRWCS